MLASKLKVDPACSIPLHKPLELSAACGISSVVRVQPCANVLCGSCMPHPYDRADMADKCSGKFMNKQRS